MDLNNGCVVQKAAACTVHKVVACWSGWAVKMVERFRAGSY